MAMSRQRVRSVIRLGVLLAFDLDDAGALLALAEWNARCVPPWSDCELLAKIAHARKYGREPIGDLRGSIWRGANR